MIKRIKVSPSLLDAFANYLTGKYNETEERLFDKINKTAQYQTTEAMFKGTAFHKVTQDGPVGLQVIRDKKTKELCYRYEFYDFNKELTDQVVELRKGFYHEQRVERTIDTLFGPVLLYGYVDDMGKGIVQDLKTCGQYHGNMAYYDSFQWRLYVYATGAHTFNYNVTDFTNVYQETYENHSDIEHQLRIHVNRYCTFINDNVNKINLALVTY